MRLLSKIVDSKTEKSYSVTKSSSSRCIPSSLPSTPLGPGRPFALQKSQSITDSSERCFKPSDSKDPHKRAFLTNLTQRVFKVGLVSEFWGVARRAIFSFSFFTRPKLEEAFPIGEKASSERTPIYFVYYIFFCGFV